MSIENVREFPFKKIVDGNSVGVEDFFNQIVKPQFSNNKAIVKTHKALMEYLNIDGNVFFLRLYGSYPKDRYFLLRRGFLTKFPNKRKMVFCDNTFSMLFAGLKIAGVSYTSVELKEYLSQRKVLCSFLNTTEERELSFYEREGAINLNLNSKGWYLAHIKPAGKGFFNRSIRDYFPNPHRNEWNLQTKIRETKTNLTEKELNVLKAHFIRLIHPFNSFLVPKKNHLLYSGNNIGEETELLIYTQEFIKKEFPVEYEEFNKITLEYDYPDYSNNIHEVSWFKEKVNENSIVLKNSKKIVSVKKGFKRKKYKMNDNNKITRGDAISLLNEKGISLNGLKFHCVNINSERYGEKTWFVTIPKERFFEGFYIICNHTNYLKLIYIEKNSFENPENDFTIRSDGSSADIYISVNSLIDLNNNKRFNFNNISNFGKSFIKKIEK